MNFACWLRASLAVRSALKAVSVALTTLVLLILVFCSVSLRVSVFSNLKIYGATVLLPKTCWVHLRLGSVTLLNGHVYIALLGSR
jgi:hypothetical protein